jgi:hypothetical protein
MSQENPYFPDAVSAYRKKGYTVLPLPENAKASPPGGFTGHHSDTPDTAQYEQWKRRFPRGNTAFRPDDGLIGFDIDTYTSGEKVKDGRSTWDDLCAQHGQPPATVISTARDPNVSGIRWYRTPKGLKWPGKLGEAIEIVQHVHRYAVVWPSIHPSTRTRYQWYAADLTQIDGPPAPAAFAELPETWVRALTKGVLYEAPAISNLSLDEADEWIDTLPIGQPCREMQAQLDRTVDSVLNEGAYDNCRDGVWAMLNLAVDGHSGVVSALTTLATTYGTEVMTRENRDPSTEWTRIVSGAVKKLSGKEVSTHCWCDWSLAPASPVVESTPGKEYVLANGRKGILRPLSQIKMKRTRWMWDKRIAMNSLSLVAGQPSMGKSTFVYWMVAALTNGNLYGEYQGKAKDVILCCTEDDYEATIKPRLAAANANLDRVFQIETKNADDIADGLNLVEDLNILRGAAEDYDIGLVVFDPLMSRLGNKDSHKDSEVRAALEPLTKLAMECGFCVLGLIHFNKSGQSGNPLNLLMGSAAFGAVARSVHVIMKDPDDDTGARRLLGTIKNNLGKTSGDGPGDLSTYAFTIKTVELPTEEEEDAGAIIQTSCLEWDAASDVTVQDALTRVPTASNAPGGKKESKQDAAAKWLRHLFETRDTTLTKAEVLAAAQRDMLSDHNEQNLGRAIKRDEFHVERKYVPDQGGVIAIWGLAEQFDD